MAEKPQLLREWYEVSERRVERVIRTVKRFTEHAPPNPFREAFRINFVNEPSNVSTASTLSLTPVSRSEIRDHSTWWKQAQIDLKAAEDEKSTSWIAYKSYQV